MISFGSRLYVRVRVYVRLPLCDSVKQWNTLVTVKNRSLKNKYHFIVYEFLRFASIKTLPAASRRRLLFETEI